MAKSLDWGKSGQKIPQFPEKNSDKIVLIKIFQLQALPHFGEAKLTAMEVPPKDSEPKSTKLPLSQGDAHYGAGELLACGSLPLNAGELKAMHQAAKSEKIILCARIKVFTFDIFMYRVD